MKYLTLILLICVSSFSLNKIVIPQRASSGSVITASKTNENLDTIASKVNKLIDSLDQKFPRFTDYSSGDSTLRSKRADFDTTVSDTMYNSGGLYSERVSTPSAGITRANIDTSHSRHATADSATITVFKGTKTFRDSSYFASGIKAPRGYFALADIDSIYGDLKFGGDLNINGNVVGIGSSMFLVPNTSDGSDSKAVGIFGGGSGFSTRGAFVSVYGNEYSSASASGDVNITAGDSGFVKITGKTGIGGTPDSTLKVTGSLHVTGNSRFGGNINGTTAAFSGAISATTLNTGNGDCEVYPMNQDVRSTASPTFVNVTSNLIGDVTGNTSGSSGSCTGNAATATTATTATNVSGGSVSATTGTFSGAISATTINTGNGAVECYAQNQDLTTTSNVTFNQISNATGIINAITEASGTFPCTLKTSDVTEQQIETISYYTTGHIVYLVLPYISGTATSSGYFRLYCTFPTEIQPATGSYVSFVWASDALRFIVFDGGINYISIDVMPYGSLWPSTGNKTIYPEDQVVSYPR